MLGDLASRILWRIRRALAVRSAPADTKANLRSLELRRVLVICYGNIYRSAYVGAYLRQRLPGTREVRSAGFHTKVDRPSPQGHVEMSSRYGVELAAHRSRLVSAEDIAWADAIVLMDRHNWQALRQHGADAAKLIWLGVLEPGAAEIPDPYGMEPPQAEAILGRLQRSSENLLRLMMR